MVVFLVTLVIFTYFTALDSTPVWTDSQQKCPAELSSKELSLDQVIGDWRLAYLFLDQLDEGLDEENSCVVVTLNPNNDGKFQLSIYIDSLRGDHIDRSTVQFDAELSTPGHWKIFTPLTSEGFMEGKVIEASDDHIVVTFCSSDYDRTFDNEIDGARLPSSAEEAMDWKTLFESAKRRKRSTEKDVHMWTVVLVRHNNVSALKFVEYAAGLMKQGLDVTKGELVSFGKCPVAHPKFSHPF